ncbi:MAG: DivIVA domain-containing protein [Actinobacteria bacterium]|nr:DivIVA domain-containing protein [Actinomycetota bacterium]
MNINSEYIQKKEFHTAFKGYGMEEVDKFLDILAVEFERISKKNNELQDSLDKAKYEGDAKAETDVNTLVSEVLVSAHKIADEIRKKAEIDVEENIQNIKDIKEKQLKDLLKERKDLESKVQFVGKLYSDFITKIKKDISEFTLKVENIEDGLKTEDVIENLQYDTEVINNTKTEPVKSSFPEYSEKNPDIKVAESNVVEEIQPIDEQIEKIIDPEIKRLSNEDEEKKIREVIESEDIKENYNEKILRDSKREKKVFDEHEEDRVIRDKKRIDIGDPDIINEFFGNSDDRKY